MNIPIVFNPDGTAECLWTEVLPLHTIGSLTMRRASNVEFNEQTQRWEVWEATGALPGVKMTRRLFAHKSRQTCLDWEQQHFNQQLEKQVE